MHDIQKMFYLRLLYYQKMLGEKYVDAINLKPTTQSLSLPKSSLQDIISHCVLCHRSKKALPAFGILPSNAKVIFVSQLPLIDDSNVFLPNKSAQMLQNIIQNIFALHTGEYGVLSLVKCNQGDSHIANSEILMCKQYLDEQLRMDHTQIVVLLGELVLSHLLGLDFDDHNGRILLQKGKKFLATYSLGQLLKNPSLKKEAMKHFLLAKGVL
ncbi:uracil-DNA glycosylase family protein [Helicobacter sp. 11S03491-1]|uniref:uracil-DNA glycosylase family protein n=1 Tax=Helicobacter sp. 11S03491-1 TaxID=1476196 RepID=UPI000BA5002D|nr:uracil-DNA glycosylase family protein [Helicobacter sp. 11S03491-1]PAF43806.1 hypothetical protein BKH45_00645 [Helicobacter sp. 11S03491-1]